MKGRGGAPAHITCFKCGSLGHKAARRPRQKTVTQGGKIIKAEGVILHIATRLVVDSRERKTASSEEMDRYQWVIGLSYR